MQSSRRQRRGKTALRPSTIVLFCILVSLACLSLQWSIKEGTSYVPGLLWPTNPGEESTRRGNRDLAPLRSPGTRSDDKRASCAAITVPVSGDQRGAQKLERMFRRDQIPGISKQTTKIGRMLRTMCAFDGRLHFGYGNQDANTGPIAMHAWDPTVEKWVYFGTLPTEEVRHFRPGAGVLYSPEIDGHGEDRKSVAAVYQLTCGSNAWSTMGNPVNGSAHIYDLVVQGPEVIVGTGSRTNEPAFVLTSNDQGETWTKILQSEALPSKHTHYYNIGANNEMVFIFGRRRRGPIRGRRHHGRRHHGRRQRHGDGGSTDFAFAWLKTSNQTQFRPIGNVEITRRDEGRWPYLFPIMLHDEMILTAFTLPPPLGRPLESYRISGTKLTMDNPWPTIGNRPTRPVFWAPDHDPNRLLVLVYCTDYSAAGVFRTASLARDPVWERALVLKPFPNGDEFVSMALLKNDLYLGTYYGNLYVVREFYKPALAMN